VHTSPRKECALTPLHACLIRNQTAASDASVEVIWDVRSAEDIAAVSNAGLSAPILLLPGAAALEADLLSVVVVVCMYTYVHA